MLRLTFVIRVFPAQELLEFVDYLNIHVALCKVYAIIFANE